jgi:large subunit ribosomal protein L35
VPKIKTRKTAAKRFYITGTGKIVRGNAGDNHLQMKKGPSRKRRLEQKHGVTTGERRNIKRMIPGL